MFKMTIVNNNYTSIYLRRINNVTKMIHLFYNNIAEKQIVSKLVFTFIYIFCTKTKKGVLLF